MLPPDLNVEELLLFLRNSHCKISFDGPHKRNAYNDITGIEENGDKLMVHVGRNSLYDSLPEYLFHPINRFDNLPVGEEKTRFVDECQKQEEEQRFWDSIKDIDDYIAFLERQLLKAKTVKADREAKAPQTAN